MICLTILVTFQLITINGFADSASKDCKRLTQEQGFECNVWARAGCEGVFTASCEDSNGKKAGVVCSVQGIEIYATRPVAKENADQLCRKLIASDPKLREQDCLQIKDNFKNAQLGVSTQVGTAQEWYSQWVDKCKDFGEISPKETDSLGQPKPTNPICIVLDQLAVEGGDKVTQLKSFQESLVKYCPDRVKVDTIIK